MILSAGFLWLELTIYYGYGVFLEKLRNNFNYSIFNESCKKCICVILSA